MSLCYDNDDPIRMRIKHMNNNVDLAKKSELYFYFQPIENPDLNGVNIIVNGHPMLQFSSYSYLNLLGHPKIQAAALIAVKEFGTGTQGVRVLTGTVQPHITLERTIARFVGTEDAMVLSSGYVTNLGVIAALLGRNDFVITDKLNHASIVDGCLLSRAKFVRFDHNNMESLENALFETPKKSGKLVVVDAVFSMDGDIVLLPEIINLCKKYKAMLMVDEAHSLGVLGNSGHGILEHFGIEDSSCIDIRMGTLSKTIPSIGGFVAGRSDLLTYLKHSVRAFVFSAALPPPMAAAAQASFEIIENEPERVKNLQANVDHIIRGLKENGFNTLKSQTPIIPIILGDDELANKMAKLSQQQGIYVLPIVAPAVPAHANRIRVCVTAGHSYDEIERAISVFKSAGRALNVIPA